METCNPLLEETEEGDGEDGEAGVEMVGDMWDGGLEEGDFAGLRQSITRLPQTEWRC